MFALPIYILFLDLAENEGAPLKMAEWQQGDPDLRQCPGCSVAAELLRLYHLAGTPNLTEALLLGTVPGIQWVTLPNSEQISKYCISIEQIVVRASDFCQDCEQTCETGTTILVEMILGRGAPNFSDDL